MPDVQPSATATLHDHIQRLAAPEPSGWPALSLYLDLAAEEHGRDRYDTFVRKARGQRLARLPQSPARHSFSSQRRRDRLRTIMSKPNKVNPGQYYVAGRLAPAEAARERVKQRGGAKAEAPAGRGKQPRGRSSGGIVKGSRSKG